ncbi:MAG: antibiotic biosynthesis monooxygenase [Nocardioidaceae bacterium]|nr:antibiotic biosynthesis monooxygenase [Nocardioidaceae bacterium]
MLVVTRYRVEGSGGEVFRRDAASALAILSHCTGYLDGVIGRNVDDPGLWTLTTRWRDVGSYRRALSSYDGKVSAVPLLSRAIPEPSAYEVLETY